jgi:hypothetical protein
MPPQLWEYKAGHPSDCYWRLPSYAGSGAMRRGKGRETEPERLHRLARSLPNYSNYKPADLRKFVQQRKLTGADSKSRKAYLVDLLRNADKNPSFARFLDLPEELRNTVYGFYCACFSDTPLNIPVHPPLARVNKQLQSEMLPVFYSQCTFAVGLHVIEGHGITGAPLPHKFRMQRETSLFFTSLSPENLAYIQKLDVEIAVEVRGQLRGIFGLRVTVPRNGKQAEARFRLIDRYYGHDGDALIHPWDASRSHIVRREWLDELEARVRCFAESIQKRAQGGNHLVRADVYRLRSMMEEFFEEQLTASTLVVR